jgi:hypothetical protein
MGEMVRQLMRWQEFVDFCLYCVMTVLFFPIKMVLTKDDIARTQLAV